MPPNEAAGPIVKELGIASSASVRPTSVPRVGAVEMRQTSDCRGLLAANGMSRGPPPQAREGASPSVPSEPNEASRLSSTLLRCATEGATLPDGTGAAACAGAVSVIRAATGRQVRRRRYIANEPMAAAMTLRAVTSLSRGQGLFLRLAWQF